MKAQVNRVTIAYSDQGTGLPIVFFHAFPLNRAMWGTQEKALSSQFRIITIDLRGHGESDAPLWRYRCVLMGSEQTRFERLRKIVCRSTKSTTEVAPK